MASRIIDRDLGADRLTRAAQRLARGLAVSVGIHESEGAEAHPSGPTVAEVAAFAEFGTEREPARSWLRGALDDSEAKLRQGLERVTERALRGADEEGALADLGEELADGMRARMATLEPLDASTIESKGNGAVLEATGTVKRAIQARVRRLMERVR